MQTEPHVVWWGLWKGALGIKHYSKKHFTENADFTLCGRNIPVGGKVTFFPKTDDDPAQTTCTICRAALKNKGINLEETKG